jgi:protein-tyrosine kinase
MTGTSAVGTALAGTQPRLDLEMVPTVSFYPSSDAVVLLDALRPGETLWLGKTPGEEFRTLRTRLEQLKATREVQTVLVTSPSAGEGKSFTAANLALAESQLADNLTLLCDFDLRSPILHRAFQIGRSPGRTA